MNKRYEIRVGGITVGSAPTLHEAHVFILARCRRKDYSWAGRHLLRPCDYEVIDRWDSEEACACVG